MVKITEYKPGEFMVNTTKEEALRLIKSLAAQLSDNDCNTHRAEFGKRHADDVEYFSIAVDESKTEFHVMTNLVNNNPINELVLDRSTTLDKAKKFIAEFKDKGIMDKTMMWIKEVTI